MQNRPLSHIRVRDFGHYPAGPLVGMMFADPGSQVGRRQKDEGIDALITAGSAGEFWWERYLPE